MVIDSLTMLARLPCTVVLVSVEPLPMPSHRAVPAPAARASATGHEASAAATPPAPAAMLAKREAANPTAIALPATTAPLATVPKFVATPLIAPAIRRLAPADSSAPPM